jgi:hypothetical protein
MTNKKETKASMEVLEKMKKRRTGLEAGKLGNEGGSPMKEEHVHKDSPESAEKTNPGHEKSEYVKEGSHLDHPRTKAIKQHKLVNDTAYFLHHPQIKPHGPSMPPKKPKC